MAESPEPTPPDSLDRRLPTKAQIRAAAYGDRTFAPAETPPPENMPPAAVAHAPDAQQADADRWIVVAAQADGWDLSLCVQVLQQQGIETDAAHSGPAAIRVRRRDFSTAVRVLQADKPRLWRKPGSSANVVVGLAVAATILTLVVGGTLAVGRLPQFEANRDVIAFGIVMPMVIMGALYLASMVRTR